MKAFAIVQDLNDLSKEAFERLKYSVEALRCEIELLEFRATVPETIEGQVEELFPGLTYTYPVQGESRIDDATGLLLRGYSAWNIKKKFSCAISHARLWRRCQQIEQDIMILEHDAIFVRKFSEFDWEGGILGLNDPRGATRRAERFHSIVSSGKGISNCPYIDEQRIPQGLAGNSAYIIRPFAARFLLDRLEEYGCWPNDALMCNQICPWLKVVYPYFTKVQGTISTTVL